MAEEGTICASPVATVIAVSLVPFIQSGIAVVCLVLPLLSERAVPGAEDVQIKSITVDLQ